MLFFFKKQKSKEAEELEENSDAVIVVNYLEENNGMEEEENHEVVKEPIDLSEEATSRAVSDCFRGSKFYEISEYDVFENLKEIEMEYGYI